MVDLYIISIAQFDKLQMYYQTMLKGSLNYLPVTAVFAAIILSSNYFLYATSKTELAPQEIKE